MLGRLGRIARGVLLAAAALLLVLSAISFFIEVSLAPPWPLRRSLLVLENGSAWLHVRPNETSGPGVTLGRAGGLIMSDAIVPTVSEMTRPAGTTTFYSFPLWLLAAACLAWPVTSLVIARRRHKRGFPVLQTARKSELSPPSEAPKVRP